MLACACAHTIANRLLEQCIVIMWTAVVGSVSSRARQALRHAVLPQATRALSSSSIGGYTVIDHQYDAVVVGAGDAALALARVVPDPVARAPAQGGIERSRVRACTDVLSGRWRWSARGGGTIGAWI